MSGKHKDWHKAWHREGDRLVHESGAVFVIVRGADCTDLRAAPETLGAYQDHELARGVPAHDLAQRLMRLGKEAAEWLMHNP